MSKMNQLSAPKDGLIGHRGAPGIAPENTLASFKAAHKQNVNWVEFDVQQCKSGEWLVLHDSTLERTTNGKGYLHNHDYDYLKTLSAGAWFSPEFIQEPIPLLTKALNCLSILGMQPNIELKTSHAPTIQTLKSLVNTIRLSWPSSLPPPLISNTHLPTLQKIRKLAPTYPLGYLIESNFSDGLQQVKDYHLDALHCHHSLISPNLLAHATEKNIPILVYTINDPKHYSQLLKAGVYGIFSDLTMK